HPLYLSLSTATAPPPASPFPYTTLFRSSCNLCHAGIEDMHPGYALTCTQCHGGNGKAATKADAHVNPVKPVFGDERVLPLDYDLDRKSTRLNSSHVKITYAVFCLKKKTYDDHLGVSHINLPPIDVHLRRPDHAIQPAARRKLILHVHDTEYPRRPQSHRDVQR